MLFTDHTPEKKNHSKDFFRLNKYFLANANNSASFKRKGLKITVFVHPQTTNKLVNEAATTIPPGLAGMIAKNGPREPIRLQDLENSARSQFEKKITFGLELEI